MQDKKVGVVVPIYNVEKYLKQCLDSVIHQSYTNLEIILINDGSTDESLKIAKEYASKDERIIIASKENGGLSSARNAGIELFNHKYKLNLNENLSKENQLNIFEILNENSLNIREIYTQKTQKELENLYIDYIIFLDSDDFWTLDCIEKCVDKMSGVDILYFKNQRFSDDGQMMQNYKGRLANYGFKKEGKISSLQCFKQMSKSKMKDFSFAADGMIDFAYLKRIGLKFKEGIFAEDHLFGILLFANADFIYILPEIFYYYRVNANSLTNDKTNEITSHLKPIYEYFKNVILTKEYFRISSWAITAAVLVEFLKKLQNSHDKNKEKIAFLIEKSFSPFYVKNAFKIQKFNKDPLNVKSKLEILKPFKHSKIFNKAQRMLLRLKLFFNLF